MKIWTENIGFEHVKCLIQTWSIKVQVSPKEVVNCKRMNFFVYGFENENSQPKNIKTIKKNPVKEKDIKKGHNIPGQVVSADHYILRDSGRIYQS